MANDPENQTKEELVRRLGSQTKEELAGALAAQLKKDELVGMLSSLKKEELVQIAERQAGEGEEQRDESIPTRSSFFIWPARASASSSFV